MNDKVACTICGEYPEIEKECGDNGTSFNGVVYRLICICGDKGQEWEKSKMVAIADWESKYFKVTP